MPKAAVGDEASHVDHGRQETAGAKHEAGGRNESGRESCTGVSLVAMDVETLASAASRAHVWMQAGSSVGV